MENGELTAGELEILRRDKQFTRLYLAFPATPVVFAARVNQAFPDGVDKIYSVTYDNEETPGSYEEILPGMSAWFGTEAGKADLGIGRIRRAAEAETLYIGETSEIDIEDDAYITVVDDFGAWVRQPYQNKSKVINMDRAIAYDDQHADWTPFVVMGADVVLRLQGGSVNLARDAGDSWCQGAAISAYQWSVTGSATITGADTATPLIEFTEAGTYRLTCAVAAGNGKAASGHRTVYVWDDARLPVTEFELTDSPAWSSSSGGWEFGVKMWGEASVQDRQKVILFSRDFYDGEETSIGPVVGSENIVAVGWIAGESIAWSPDGSSVEFDVKGVAWWLDQGQASSIDLKDVGQAAEKWDEIYNLTVDKALMTFLLWRSTVPLISDCELTGDTRYAWGFETQPGSLWQQINTIAWRIRAVVNCDPFGRLFAQVDPQYTPIGSRGSIPHVLTVTTEDWEGGVELERNPLPACSRYELIGRKMTSGAKKSATFYSLSQGHVHRRFGQPEADTEPVLVSSQAQLNTLCGLAMAQRNNPWGQISINLAANNRAVNGVPRQFVELYMGAGQTPRGEAFSGNVIPREVSFELRNGALLTKISAEAATKAAATAIVGDIPENDDLPEYPPEPPIDPPEPPEPPYPPTPGTLGEVRNVVMLTLNNGVFFTDEFHLDSPRWWSLNAAFSGLPNLYLLEDLEITPNGTIYVRSGDTIFSGPFGSPPYLKTVFDQDWLDEQYPHTDWDIPFFGALGVNRNAADQIAILAGTGYLGTRTTDIWVGNSRGLTKGAPFDGTWLSYEGKLVFADGAWVAAFGYGLGARGIARFSGSGSSREMQEQNLADDGAGGEMSTLISAGGSGKLWGWSNGHIWYSTDNGTARITVPGVATDKYLYKINKSMDFHANGSYGMNFTGGVLKASTDGGLTFPNTVLVRTGFAVECLSEDIWIAGGGNFVEATPDFGETWLDKTGNLNAQMQNNFDVLKIVAVL